MNYIKRKEGVKGEHRINEVNRKYIVRLQIEIQKISSHNPYYQAKCGLISRQRLLDINIKMSKEILSTINT